MRLDKYIADCTGCSRKEAAESIKKGHVTVEGIPGKPKADLSVDPSGTKVCLEGRLLDYQALHYLILHKPAGYITASQGKGQACVMDLLPFVSKDLVPVGRLDKDTEGLLFFTDDGQLNHRLLSPRRHVDKTYEVHTASPVSRDQAERLRQGVDIGDETPTMPARAEVTAEGILLLTIQEGRFHQVKRMLEAVGNRVTYLKRLTFGPLDLGDLEPGQYRMLDTEEVEAVKNA